MLLQLAFSTTPAFFVMSKYQTYVRTLLTLVGPLTSDTCKALNSCVHSVCSTAFGAEHSIQSRYSFVPAALCGGISFLYSVIFHLTVITDVDAMARVRTLLAVH